MSNLPFFNISNMFDALAGRHAKKENGVINMSFKKVDPTLLQAIDRVNSERDKYAPYAPKNKTVIVPNNSMFGGMHPPFGNFNLFSNRDFTDRSSAAYSLASHEPGHNASKFMSGTLPIAPLYQRDEEGDKRKVMDRRRGLFRYSVEEPSVQQDLGASVMTGNVNLDPGYEIFSRNPYMYYLNTSDTGPLSQHSIPGTMDEFANYTMPYGKQPSKWEKIKHYLKWALAGAATGAGVMGAGSLLRNRNSKNIGSSSLKGAIGGGLLGLLGAHIFRPTPMKSPYIDSTPDTNKPAKLNPLINSLELSDEDKSAFISEYGDKTVSPLSFDNLNTEKKDERLTKLENWVNEGLTISYGEFERRKALANMANRGINIVRDENGVLTPTPLGVLQGLSQKKDPKTAKRYDELKQQVLSRLSSYRANPRYLNVMKKWRLSPEGEGITGSNDFHMTIEQMENALKDFDKEDKNQDMDNSIFVNGGNPFIQTA